MEGVESIGAEDRLASDWRIYISLQKPTIPVVCKVACHGPETRELLHKVARPVCKEHDDGDLHQLRH